MTLASRLAPYEATFGADPDPWDPAHRWPLKSSAVAAAPEPPHSPAATAEPVIAMSIVPESWGQKVEISL